MCLDNCQIRCIYVASKILDKLISFCSCHFGISRKVFQPRACRDGREHGGLNPESLRRFTQINLPKTNLRKSAQSADKKSAFHPCSIRGGNNFTLKRRDTNAADAIFVPQIRRHLRKQRFGNFYFGAPARTFVGRNGAELAVVGQTTQRTLARVQCLLRGAGIHFGWIFQFQSQPVRIAPSRPPRRNGPAREIRRLPDNVRRAGFPRGHKRKSFWSRGSSIPSPPWCSRPC